jgi:DNA-binding transcriptional ArsR family regulator
MRRKAVKNSEFSREALELIAQRFRALGDATRLALLQALFERERTVQDLCAVTRASQANTSKHLALLLDQGLVARRRDGLFTRYRIADRTLEPSGSRPPSGGPLPASSCLHPETRKGDSGPTGNDDSGYHFTSRIPIQ